MACGRMRSIASWLQICVVSGILLTRMTQSPRIQWEISYKIWYASLIMRKWPPLFAWGMQSSHSPLKLSAHDTFDRHDWGSQVCYEAARMRPDIFIGVVGLTVPVCYVLPLLQALPMNADSSPSWIQYMPNAGNYTPIKSLIQYFPRLAYQAYFDEKTYDAAKELDNDVRRSLRSTLRTVSSPPPDNFLESQTSYMDAWKDVKEVVSVCFHCLNRYSYLILRYLLSRS